MRQHFKKNQFPFLAVLEIPHLFINPRTEKARCVEPWQSLDMKSDHSTGTGGFYADEILTLSLSSNAFADLNEQLFIERVRLT